MKLFIAVQNFNLNKFAFNTHCKMFSLVEDIKQNDFSNRFIRTLLLEKSFLLISLGGVNICIV